MVRSLRFASVNFVGDEMTNIEFQKLHNFSDSFMERLKYIMKLFNATKVLVEDKNETDKI